MCQVSSKVVFSIIWKEPKLGSLGPNPMKSPETLHIDTEDTNVFMASYVAPILATYFTYKKNDVSPLEQNKDALVRINSHFAYKFL